MKNIKKILFMCFCFMFLFTKLDALEVEESMNAIADYAVYLKDNYNSYFYYDSSDDYKLNKLDTFNGLKTFNYKDKCLFVMGKQEFISFVFHNATGLMNDPNPTYLNIFLLNYNGNWLNNSNEIQLIKTFDTRNDFNTFDLYRGDIVGYSSNDKYELYIYNGNDNFITITDNYPNSIGYVSRSKLSLGNYSVFRITKLVSNTLERDNSYKTSVVLRSRKDVDFSENTSCIVKTYFTDSVIYKQIKKVYIIIMIIVMLIINILNYLAVKDEMSIVKERGIISIIYRTVIFLVLLLIPLIIESIVKII